MVTCNFTFHFRIFTCLYSYDISQACLFFSVYQDVHIFVDFSLHYHLGYRLQITIIVDFEMSHIENKKYNLNLEFEWQLQIWIALLLSLQLYSINKHYYDSLSFVNLARSMPNLESSI